MLYKFSIWSRIFLILISYLKLPQLQSVFQPPYITSNIAHTYLSMTLPLDLVLSLNNNTTDNHKAKLTLSTLCLPKPKGIYTTNILNQTVKRSGAPIKSLTSILKPTTINITNALWDKIIALVLA